MYVSPQMAVANVSIVKAATRPDAGTWHGNEVYDLAWLFTTLDGSWDPTSDKFSITQEPRDRFLKPMDDPEYCNQGGADHNLIQAVIGQNGKLMHGKGLLYWSDGYAKLGSPGYDGYVRRNTDDHGWGDIEIFPPGYDPQTEQGPWCMCPIGLSDVVVGMGMPWRWHVSFFGVWQARAAGVVVPPGPADPPASGDLGTAILTEIKGLRSDLRLIYRGLT